MAASGVLLLVACSDSGDGPSDDIETDPTAEVPGTEPTTETDGDNVEFIGSITVTVDSDLNVQDVTGDFLQLDPAVPSDAVLALALANDECNLILIPEGGDPSINLTEMILGSDVDFASAGEIITLTSPAGTYTELTQVVALPNDANYVTGSLPPGPVPAGTLVDIPGDIFPAFSNLAIPENIIPLTDFSPAGGPLTSTFTWTPTNDPNSRVGLGFAAGITVSGTTVSASTIVLCSLIDDGSFSLPMEILDQIEPNLEILGGVNPTRQLFNFFQVGNALVSTSIVSDLSDTFDLATE